jgi:viroplasmin and RNaseH domain-containing protein
MKQTINFSQFCDAFHGSQYKENFSYQGKRALFDYLEEYEQDCGNEIELDICSICCDYAEDDLDDVLANYGLDNLYQLENRTTVVNYDHITGLVVYGVF